MKLHYHPLSSYSRKALIGIGLRSDATPHVEGTKARRRGQGA